MAALAKFEVAKYSYYLNLQKNVPSKFENM